MSSNKLILKSFLKKRELVRQHIDSFNDFLDNRLQEIVNDTANIETDVGVEVQLGKITVKKARIIEADGSKNRVNPMEARLRNLSYFSPISLEMTPVVEGKEPKTVTVKIGMMPLCLSLVFVIYIIRLRRN